MTTGSEKRRTALATAAKWGQQRRLEFIDFRLYWEGRINRADLTAHFGISVPQASLDLARYQELAPRNLTYERREKVYLATAEFKPALAREHSDSYLDQLLAVATGALAKDSVFIGWAPPTDLVRSPYRRISPGVLLALLRAIRDELVVEIAYQSLDQSAPITRHISPHALAFDGFLWHARAYCHAREKFCDFALARLLHVEPRSRTSVDALADSAWNTFLEVKLAPHPSLTDGQRRVVELEFGMTGGVVVIPSRVALLPCLLRQLRLSPTRDSHATQQLVLLNAEKLAPYLHAEGEQT